MKITAMSVQNFKGQTFKLELSPVTLISGANSCGKSARLEALMLGLLGYMPQEQKPLRAARDIFELYASGPSMEIALFDDQGKMYQRIWQQKGVTVTYRGHEGPVVPEAGADPGAYLSLSGPDRLRFLLAQAQLPKEMSADGIINTLAAAAKNTAFEVNTPDTEAGVMAVNSWLRLFAMPDKMTVNEWIAGLEAQARNEKLDCDRSVKRMEQAVQAATQSSNPNQEPLDPAAEAKLAQAQERYREASKLLFGTQTLLKESRAQYTAEFKLAQGLVDVTEIEKRKAVVEAEILKLQLAPGAATEPELRAAWASLSGQANEENGRVAAVTKELSKMMAQLEQLQKDGKCPCCRKKFPKSDADAFASELNEATKKAEVMQQEQLKTSAKARLALDAHSAECQRRDAMERWNVELNRLKQTIADQAVAGGAKKRADAIALAGKDLASKETAQQAAVATAQQDVAAAESAARRLLASRAEAAARARNVAEAEQWRARVVVWKEVLACLKALQTEIVERATGPLLAKLNELCAEQLPGPVSYRDGELVLGRDGKQWTHRTCSDSEKLLIYAGLALALAAQSPLKLAVIGRLESLDCARAFWLIRKTMAMIDAGQLDQCVFIEVNHGDMPIHNLKSDKFKVVNLDK